VIARGYGFAGWPQLKRKSVSLTKSPAERFKAAVESGDVDQVQQLLRDNRDLVSRLNEPMFSFNSPAVHVARTNLALLDMLLAYGADLNARTSWEKGGFGVLEQVSPDEAGLRRVDRSGGFLLRRRLVSTLERQHSPTRSAGPKQTDAGQARPPVPYCAAARVLQGSEHQMPNHRSRRVAAAVALAAGLASMAPGIVAAQEFPSRPIEFIVPWGPGGGADQVARKLAKLMESRLKVSMPVVNVPGATGQTGLTKMLTAPADGYAISVFIGDTFALQAGTPAPKWTMQDIEPLGVVIQQASAFLVQEGGRFKDWADLEKAARTERLRVGVTGFGSNDDLTANFFAKKGLKFSSVPFPKPGERYSAVLGGHAEVLYEQIGDVRSFIDGKQIRPVILFAGKRDPSFPDVPSSVELGHNVMLPQFRAVVVKSGTDPSIVKTLADALAEAAGNPEYVAYLKDQYAAANSFVAAADTRAFLDNELKAMNQLIASSGATQDAAPPEPKK
jgi:putative tricarboxylic transport membrane protein